MTEAPTTTPDHPHPLVQAGLLALGVKKLVFGIHDASFPAGASEDPGCGSPRSRAAERLLAFVRGLGFTGVQVGPQGLTTAHNPSPYDATLFSRNVETIALRTFEPDGPWAGLVREETLRRAACATVPRADHPRAHAVMRGVLDEAFAAFERGDRADLEVPVRAFEAQHRAWLTPDALYDALRGAHGGSTWTEWTRGGAPDPDRSLWRAEARGGEQRRAQLVEEHRRELRRYAFAQAIAHAEHAELRRVAGRLGLALYGDHQIGLSDGDAWAYADCFLRGYRMGAPPSRTNPEGQPWGYPVLDPCQYTDPGGGPGAALRLLSLRVDKAFEEYDGLRIDHPHGLVCPWVYRADSGDDLHAVQHGARLFESPDLPPQLAPYAIARADQLDRALPRYADDWVRSLDEEQIDRYAVVFDAIVAAAAAHGRATSDLVCEVLSTQPVPLGRVLARHGLGRFRVLQKASLDDPSDVYRPENALPEDWVMLGTHDTRPIWAVVRAWTPETRARWTDHLSGVLRLGPTDRAALTSRAGLLPAAMLASLLASRAENVMVFFTDLFGFEESYNAPGTVSDSNWTLRLPPTFEAMYTNRVRLGEALCLPRALALALRARGARGELLNGLVKLAESMDGLASPLP